MKLRLFIILLFPITLCAQPLLKEVPYFPFINYEKNKLQFPNGRESQNTFYQLLDSLLLFGEGDVNILHIGGSHVQADVFTNRMRSNLTSMLPSLDSDRGVLFPYRVAKTNNPQNYQVRYSGSWDKNQNSKYKSDIALGISGWAVTTTDAKASITIKLNRDSAKLWQFDQIRLIAISESDSLMPLAIVHGDTLVPQFTSESNSYLFAPTSPSDSVTFLFPQAAESVNSYTISAIIPENDRHGITYHAIGVNGASVPAWLRCENFQKEMVHVQPDLVVFAIGINDANVPYGKFKKEQFINNYRVLIERIRMVAPNTAFLFITNNDAYYRIGRNNRIPNKNGALVQEAFYELATMYNAGVWDLYDIMGGLGSMQKWQNKSLANADKIHFTHQGYLLLGDLFFNALLTDYLYHY